jgi:hypothetical protein
MDVSCFLFSTCFFPDGLACRGEKYLLLKPLMPFQENIPNEPRRIFHVISLNSADICWQLPSCDVIFLLAPARIFSLSFSFPIRGYILLRLHIFNDEEKGKRDAGERWGTRKEEKIFDSEIDLWEEAGAYCPGLNSWHMA